MPTLSSALLIMCTLNVIASFLVIVTAITTIALRIRCLILLRFGNLWRSHHTTARVFQLAPYSQLLSTATLVQL